MNIARKYLLSLTNTSTWYHQGICSNTDKEHCFRTTHVPAQPVTILNHEWWVGGSCYRGEIYMTRQQYRFPSKSNLRGYNKQMLCRYVTVCPGAQCWVLNKFTSTRDHLSVESGKLNEFWSYKDMLSYFTQTKEYHSSVFPPYV